MEITQSPTPTVKSSRHGKHKNPNYQREYYRQNREKLLTYSKDYYGVKKLFSSHAHHNNILPSKTKNLFFLEGGSKKEKLERRLDKERLRLATKDKRALKKYWNQPWFKEWLSKASLLSKYQE